MARGVVRGLTGLGGRQWGAVEGREVINPRRSVPPFEVKLAFAAQKVEDRLSGLLVAQAPATPPRLLAAMRHALLGGGKRFRPYLVLESAALLKADSGAALEVAAALECVHCYSLVHDDLPSMDNDDLRRGRPTVWKAYDEWTAVLAGDALLTLAFEVLTDDGLTLPGATTRELVRRLALASGPRGMVGGQVLDLEADKLGLPQHPDAEHIKRLQAMKTGALIQFACEAGPILVGATPRVTSALRDYGEALGRAFQLSDDLLDATGEAGIVGKAVGKDAIVGKATLVSLTSVDAAKRELAGLVMRAESALAPFGDDAGGLVEAARYMARRDR